MVVNFLDLCILIKALRLIRLVRSPIEVLHGRNNENILHKKETFFP